MTFRIAFIIVLACLITSCSVNKNIPYFKDYTDSTGKITTIKGVNFSYPVIKPDDILYITVNTINQEVTNLVNEGNASGTENINGYLVDEEGFVDLPFAGKIKLAGFTSSQAKEVVRKEMDKYFNNVSVNVRFSNFKITILGEVNNPSTFVVPNEKLNLFEAIGLAGDLTLFGQRECFINERFCRRKATCSVGFKF